MNYSRYTELFNSGAEAFRQEDDVYTINPYKRIDNFRHDVQGFQVEATPFFNGWEFARRKYDGKSKYSIFLDDFRFPNWVNWIELPKTHWTICRHYYDFVDTVQRYGIPEYVSWDFDLDLHGHEHIKSLPYLTGLDSVKWMMDYCIKNNENFPKSTIHSANPDGAKQIYNLLTGSKE